MDTEARELNAHMARGNLLWSAPSIYGELLELGFTVSEATVYRPVVHLASNDFGNARVGCWLRLSKKPLVRLGQALLPV